MRPTIVVRIVGLAVWVGAVVACALKLSSPHRSVMSWLVAALVGGVGGVGGLFVARLVGFSREQEIPTLVVAGLVAGGVVVLWALLSRAAVRGRETRPTIAF